MRMYYIYSKVPKKCRDLEVIVTYSCFDSFEFPIEGSNRPPRACGTRYIAHKVAAWNDYLNHLTTLTEDPSTKSNDKQKLYF